jgi:hypothetical protein
MTRNRTPAALLVLALVGAPSLSHAFECPQPDAASPFVLQETKQEQQTLAQLLASGDMENRLGEIVADLRRKHPGVPRYELVNYLVGVYCPAVKAMPDLSDTAKTQKVGQFAETAFDLIAKQQL